MSLVNQAAYWQAMANLWEARFRKLYHEQTDFCVLAIDECRKKSAQSYNVIKDAATNLLCKSQDHYHDDEVE